MSHQVQMPYDIGHLGRLLNLLLDLWSLLSWGTNGSHQSVEISISRRLNGELYLRSLRKIMSIGL